MTARPPSLAGSRGRLLVFRVADKIISKGRDPEVSVFSCAPSRRCFSMTTARRESLWCSDTEPVFQNGALEFRWHRHFASLDQTMDFESVISHERYPRDLAAEVISPMGDQRSGWNPEPRLADSERQGAAEPRLSGEQRWQHQWVFGSI